MAVTEYEPLSFTTTRCVVEPFDQTYTMYPSLATSVTESPAQNVVVPCAVITGAGRGRNVTMNGADVPLHPVASFTSTVKLSD